MFILSVLDATSFRLVFKMGSTDLHTKADKHQKKLDRDGV